MLLKRSFFEKIEVLAVDFSTFFHRNYFCCPKQSCKKIYSLWGTHQHTKLLLQIRSTHFDPLIFWNFQKISKVYEKGAFFCCWNGRFFKISKWWQSIFQLFFTEIIFVVQNKAGKKFIACGALTTTPNYCTKYGRPILTP